MPPFSIKEHSKQFSLTESHTTNATYQFEITDGNEMIGQQAVREVACESCEGHWSATQIASRAVHHHNAKAVGPTVGATKDKCKRLSSGATKEED